MGQEAAAEQRVVLGLDGAALAHALDPLGAAAAGAMQAQPVAARLQPMLDGAALRGVGIGAGHVGDQQLADRQPFLDVGEVVGDRGRNVLLGQQLQQPQAGIVVVVPGMRTGRKTAGDEMRAAGLLPCHWIDSPFSTMFPSCDRTPRNTSMDGIRLTSTARSALSVHCYTQFRGTRSVPCTVTNLRVPLPRPHRCAQQERIMGARHSRLRLDPDPPRVARNRLRLAHFDDRAEWIVLVDMALKSLPSVPSSSPNPVDPHHPGRTTVVRSGGAVSGPGSGGSSASAAARRAHRQFERSAEHRHRRVLRRSARSSANKSWRAPS